MDTTNFEQNTSLEQQLFKMTSKSGLVILMGWGALGFFFSKMAPRGLWGSPNPQNYCFLQ